MPSNSARTADSINRRRGLHGTIIRRRNSGSSPLGSKPPFRSWRPSPFACSAASLNASRCRLRHCPWPGFQGGGQPRSRAASSIPDASSGWRNATLSRQESEAHPLRYAAAQLRNGYHRDTSSIRLTQKASGHANLATTQIYAHIVDEELDQAMKSFRKAKVAAKARWIDTLHAITADSSSEDHPSKAVS